MTDQTKQAASRGFFKNLSRKEYIEKASELMRREGAQAISLRRIAAELDCSTTALYRHFENLEELLFYVNLSELNTYIANLHERMPSWKSMWDMHFDIWELYADQAFRRTQAFESIFYSNLKQDLGSALEEYYTMFPEAIVDITPLIREMLQIPDYYKRDAHILKYVVKDGLLSQESAKQVNHIECNLFLGYFKYAQETALPPEQVGRLVAQFMDEIKDIISLYQQNDRLNGRIEPSCVPVKPGR